MQANRKWLLIPPALALVLFLGPLRTPGVAAAPLQAPTPASALANDVAKPATKGLPQTPALQ